MLRNWIMKIFGVGIAMKSTPSGWATAGVFLDESGPNTRSTSAP